MKVKILKECGYEEALLGLSLSYNADDMKKIEQRAIKLAQMDGGHNKFLESMILWIDIDAPRYWWSQFDTYRIGITKQSESTMHTILKRELTMDNFDVFISGTILDIINTNIRTGDFDSAKAHLPESFLQRRIICTNYKTLRCIISQRHGHKLKQWQNFINSIYEQINYPNFLPIIRNFK